MATLRIWPTPQELQLPHHAVLGRSSNGLVQIPDPRVSGQHAEVAWNGVAWTVKDLGSRNGTFLNARRLESGKREPLRVGDVLHFATPECGAELCDDAPPTLWAQRTDTGEALQSEDDVLALPGATVYGEGTHYWLEIDGERSTVSDGQRVRVGGLEWQLALPPRGAPPDFTLTDMGALRLEEVALRFDVSSDEEHVEIAVVGPEGEQKLPTRAFGYLLLELARTRLRDCDDGLAEAEQGWVYADELAASLGMDLSRLNVDIFRARRHFERVRLINASEVIERRSSTRQLRLGIARIAVARAAPIG